ncbi:SRPBCC domain-containing protein [Aliiroseovarius crassostreae]|uniref:SRPBCC domain-containing protein n=1 Tax=Aliiroseovarius crassostreae TaxID=154981 RepID=UPI0022085983|nr:SRPBCC domain-containing protein [Aliiroseovarius crassostreae]UWP88261.1 SRPBCC domain-containing protein [Aliiroseovarius crassostreae]UWP91420.1 SRPBCC domain-containing protein [Aliiroseovarius crassostreae]UWP97739.1 SRPBCC domain-containing protein [Aliiroseovarius crassostreae]UWQ00923.1 SRPBCC domain-containing protein [Aliiroseovarius crassostreae]
MLPPIIKTVRSPLPREELFEFFTLGLGNWWPVATHSVSANMGGLPQEVHFETREGGRIYEVLPKGDEALWGRVLHWDAPSRVVFSWHPGRDPGQATRVQLRFVQLATQTEIELIHDGWEALGDEASTQHAGYDPGWDYVFGQCFMEKLV